MGLGSAHEKFDVWNRPEKALFSLALTIVCRDRVIVWLIPVLFRESTKQLITGQFVVPLFNRAFLDMARNWGEMLGSPSYHSICVI